MTPFLTAMKDVAQQLHRYATQERNLAVIDMRNAVAQHFAGGVLPAHASLAIFTAVSAQAIADMLLQVPPEHVQEADIAKLFADELRAALARNQPAGLLKMNGAHIG